MRFEIRLLASIDEYRACEHLQREAWQFSDDLDVIPVTQLVATQKAGGLVIGAFDENRDLVGFCYGFVGLDDGDLLHYSQMAAVTDAYRGTGLGARLKWKQRDHAREQGLNLMAWTFDPLQSMNAYFNLNKLGAVASKYYVDLYGQTTSVLHRGTPTDRLLVRWYLDSPRVRRRSEGERSRLSAAWRGGETDFEWALEAERPGDPGSGPLPACADLEADLVACEIPPAIEDLKAVAPEAARAWRFATREVMTSYLERGYFVRDVGRIESGSRRTAYLLGRRVPDLSGLED